MKRSLRRLGVCGMLGALLLLAGCVSSETMGPKEATGVWGYVASSKNATLAIDASKSTIVSVVASRVVSPGPGFIVATASGEGTGVAMQVGVVPVKAGESTNLTIPIMGVMTSQVLLTLFVDHGRQGLLEFDPMKPVASPDRPVFVDGKPVAVTVTVSPAQAPTGSGNAVLDVFDQAASKGLTVTHVVAPGPSWLVVYADQNGVPGKELGRLALSASDLIGVTVPLAHKPAPGGVFVALHTDAGMIGTFERPTSTGATSTPGGADTVYVVGGGQVMKRIVLR